MVNQKVKRRRTSLISSKYSSTLQQQANRFSLHTQLAQANIKSKNLFNLSGKNKQESTNTLVQHMKTINMFSVYFLVQPKAPSEKQTTTSNNKSILAIDENQLESSNDSSLDNNNKTSNCVVDSTDSTVVVVPLTRKEMNYLRVDDIKPSAYNVSSSFNSTTSTRASSTKCADENDNLNLETSLMQTKLRQHCVSLENNALITNIPNEINEIEEEICKILIFV